MIEGSPGLSENGGGCELEGLVPGGYGKGRDAVEAMCLME